MNSAEEEKVNEGGRKRGELLMGEKLRRGVLVGKREGNSTPSPTWKLGLIQADGTLVQDLNFSTKSNTLSARKLGANLWDMQPLRRSKITNNAPGSSHHHKEEEEEDSPSNKPTNVVNSRKQRSPSLTQHNLRVEKVALAQQPLSTASYCSSMEMAPHRPAIISPSRSLVSSGKFVESSHSLKTSTELLKVLNRIWSLEEKHALDMSLVKTLRKELGESNARIQELLQEKDIEQNKVDTLTNQVQLAENKLEDELKLRRKSEKRHDKLSNELSEIKSLFSNDLKELEQERKARTLIEDLCDEFAKGIREYEQEVRLMKHKSHKDKIRKEGNDRLILHMSEAWLDERAQMKLADDVSEKQSSLDKLIVEIEAFLRVKQSVSNPTKNDYKSTKRDSLESIHLNEPASAPWKGIDEDDSASTGNHCSQFCRGVIMKQANKTVLSEKEESTKSRIGSLYDTKSARMPQRGGTMQRSLRQGRNRISDAGVDLEDARTRNRLLESEDKRLRSKSSCMMEGSFEASMFGGPQSPVRKWTSEVSAEDPEISVVSSPRWQKSVKADTLKAKLMEARLEGRAKISKG